MSSIGYIAGGANGWLNVRLEPEGTVVAVPQYLGVDIGESRSGREYFTVREGVYRGHAGSVIAGNLQFGNPGHRAAARLEFSLSRQLLSFAGGQARAVAMQCRAAMTATCTPAASVPGASRSIPRAGRRSTSI